MSRKPSHGPEWNELINLVGGVEELRKSLGISQTTWYRVSHGVRQLPADKQEALEILCELYDTANPLEGKVSTKRAKDLSHLRMLGEALERGFPPARRTIDRLKAMYPESQLLELAESDGTPPNVLRAVAVLLEAE